MTEDNAIDSAVMRALHTANHSKIVLCAVIVAVLIVAGFAWQAFRQGQADAQHRQDQYEQCLEAQSGPPPIPTCTP